MSHLPGLDMDDLLGPGPIAQIRLDLTTRCNLRCVYCAVSQPTHRGIDMADGTAARATALTLAMSNVFQPHTINVNGHGETTFLRNWDVLLSPLLQAQIPLSITTNLAKTYSQAEFNALGRFHAIAVSIDTGDAALLRDMRRKVDLDQVVANMRSIRQAARRSGLQDPRFTFLAGLYQASAMTAPTLASLAARVGAVAVQYWDLRAYDLTALDIPRHQWPVRLAALDDAALISCLRCIEDALRIADGAGIEMSFQADFVARLARERGLLFETNDDDA